MKEDNTNLFLLLLVLVSLSIILIPMFGVNELKRTQPAMRSASQSNKIRVPEAQNTITPIKDTKHFMVSAFIDHRFKKAIRVISIIRRDSLQTLYCICCNGYNCHIVEAEVQIHRDHFGFPFGASDVLCQAEHTENATYVAISTAPNISNIHKMEFLIVNNREERGTFRSNFTVCISSLFGAYNNVLQFAQSMEMYKLLGVQHVVLYNTSCGPDLEKLLHHYKREGILEIISWPIDQFLNPSAGWNSEIHEGELHYYGQIVTLNECIYRHMYQSQYVLLHDIDEIILPSKQANLPLLMDRLQREHKHTGVFIFENHVFPKTQFEESGKFRRPEWKNVPGVNIMEHIYREPDRMDSFNPTKMIVNPRTVVQTSVHSTLINLRHVYMVPFNVSYILHVRDPLQKGLTKKQLLADTRLWDFAKELIPNVNKALQSSGLLKMPD